MAHFDLVRISISKAISLEEIDHEEHNCSILQIVKNCSGVFVKETP